MRQKLPHRVHVRRPRTHQPRRRWTRRVRGCARVELLISMTTGVVTLTVVNTAISQIKVEPTCGEVLGESSGAATDTRYLGACIPNSQDFANVLIARVAGRRP
jgi:hypothetical protein